MALTWRQNRLVSAIKKQTIRIKAEEDLLIKRQKYLAKSKQELTDAISLHDWLSRQLQKRFCSVAKSYKGNLYAITMVELETRSLMVELAISTVKSDVYAISRSEEDIGNLTGELNKLNARLEKIS